MQQGFAVIATFSGHHGLSPSSLPLYVIAVPLYVIAVEAAISLRSKTHPISQGLKK